MARFQTERTYIMIKPDGVQRGLVGEIISRFENKGFVLKGLKMFQTPKELAQEHYKARQIDTRAPQSLLRCRLLFWTADRQPSES